MDLLCDYSALTLQTYLFPWPLTPYCGVSAVTAARLLRGAVCGADEPMGPRTMLHRTAMGSLMFSVAAIISQLYRIADVKMLILYILFYVCICICIYIWEHLKTNAKDHV